MENSSGNGPLIAMTFIVGLGAVTLTGVLSSILVAVLVGLLGKAVDVALRAWITRRENRWRREAERLAAELQRLRPPVTGKRECPRPSAKDQLHGGER